MDNEAAIGLYTPNLAFMAHYNASNVAAEKSETWIPHSVLL